MSDDAVGLDPGAIQRAARAIAGAEALVVTAGAGMGVDSGLPDFRGPEGFWQAYPSFAQLQLSFADVANPTWFRDDPHLAWGFYGHRLNLYRATRPHDGFATLGRWVASAPLGGFVFTSNVDGHFQRAGFDPERVVECHGAIDWFQCTARCGVGPFEAPSDEVRVDPETIRAQGELPRCHACGALARPNILMFGDCDWDDARTEAQYRRFRSWVESLKGRSVAILECGAGTAIPTVRHQGAGLAQELDATLIRINLRDPQVGDARHVSLPGPARLTLAAIDAARPGRAGRCG